MLTKAKKSKGKRLPEWLVVWRGFPIRVLEGREFIDALHTELWNAERAIETEMLRQGRRFSHEDIETLRSATSRVYSATLHLRDSCLIRAGVGPGTRPDGWETVPCFLALRAAGGVFGIVPMLEADARTKVMRALSLLETLESYPLAETRKNLGSAPETGAAKAGTGGTDSTAQSKPAAPGDKAEKPKDDSSAPGTAPNIPPRIWARDTCPSCGHPGVVYLSVHKFKRRARTATPNRSTLTAKIKNGIYCANADGKLPWCSSCKEQTPLGAGVPPQPDAPPANDYVLTEEDKNTITLWAQKAVSTEKRDDEWQPNTLEHDDWDEAYQNAYVAIAELVKSKRGDVTRDQAEATAKEAFKKHYSERDRSLNATEHSNELTDLDEHGRRVDDGHVRRQQQLRDANK